MNIEEVMGKYGFRLSAGCSGKAAYTKNVKHNGKRAFISVTNVNGEGFPTAMTDPVREMIYDLKSGDELIPGRDFDSLEAYLRSIQE